jgi:hypothetical protein
MSFVVKKLPLAEQDALDAAASTTSSTADPRTMICRIIAA